MTKRLIALSLISALLLLGVGCNGQTAAAILQAAVTSVTAVIQIYAPNWKGAAKFAKDAQNAITAVANFKPGTPAQDVVQILSIVSADIGDISGLPTTATLAIQIAIAGVDSVISIISAQGSKVAGKKTVVKPPTYTSAKQYKAAWNAAIKADPKLAGAKIQ